MAPEEQARLRAYAEQWRRAAPLLERQREEDVRNRNTISAFAFFAGMPLHHLAHFPPEPTSGLVEQQRWFRKIQGR